MVLNERQKSEIKWLADRTLKIQEGQGKSVILAARWVPERKYFRPHLVTWSEFDRDESLILVDQRYRPRTFVSTFGDNEPEKNIVTGSIDPKSGRVRIVIDVEELWNPVKAAPIEDQINWDIVPRFKLPSLDQVPGWSEAQDQALNKILIESKEFKPQSQPVVPKLKGLQVFIQYPNDPTVHELIRAEAHRIRQKFPEARMDRYFAKVLKFNRIFERLQGEVNANELMRPRPADARASILRDLYESGQLDEFPFKLIVTALMLARGFRRADEASDVFLDEAVGLRGLSDDDFRRLKWIFTERDFYTYQSVIESLLGKIESSYAEIGLWTSRRTSQSFTAFVAPRFKVIWESLTKRQKEAAMVLHMSEDPPSLKDASKVIGISVDTLRNRDEGVKKKFRKALPELSELRPSKGRTRNSRTNYIYWGLYSHASAKVVHPLFRITERIVGDLKFEVREWIPAPNERRPAKPPSPEIGQWLEEFREKAQFVSKIDEPDDPDLIKTERKRGRRTLRLDEVY